MPFIDVRTDKTISTEQENALKAELGSAIALIPGKSEDSLMVQFTDNCRMWFGGKQGNAAMVNVMLYGSAEKASYRAFSDRVIPSVESTLGVGRVYLKFEEVPNWFWN